MLTSCAKTCDRKFELIRTDVFCDGNKCKRVLISDNAEEAGKIKILQTPDDQTLLFKSLKASELAVPTCTG